MINLANYDGRISNTVKEANVVMGSNESIARAVGNLGNNAFNIFSELSMKERENDVKQSAWDAHANYTAQINSDILDATAKTDSNGSIIKKRNDDGTVEYEMNKDGKPVSYREYIVDKIAEHTTKFKDSFNGDTDKEVYFKSLSNNFNQDTIIKSVLAQNNIVNKYTMKKISEDWDKSTSEIVNYDQPDFLSVAEQRVQEQIKKARDIGTPVNNLETEKMIEDKAHETAIFVSRKALSHAQHDISSDKMLSDFSGSNFIFSANARGYLKKYLRDRYDSTEVDAALKKLVMSQRDAVIGWRKSIESKIGNNDRILKVLDNKIAESQDPSVLSMDFMDIEGELPPADAKIYEKAKEEANAEAIAKNTLFNRMTPTEQEKWTEDVINIKFAKDGQRQKDLDIQWKDLVDHAGSLAGSKIDPRYFTSKAKEIYLAAVADGHPDWKSPTQVVNKLADMQEAQMKSELASRVFRLSPEAVTRLTSNYRRQAAGFILETTKLPNGEYDKGIVARLNDPSATYGKLGGPNDNAAQKQAQQMVREYNRDPDGYRLSHGLQEGYTRLALKAANGDVAAMKKLALTKDMHERTMGVPTTEQKYSIDSSFVKQVANNLNQPLMNGDYLGAANYIATISKMPPALFSKALRDLESNRHISKEVAGSMIFNSLGGDMNTGALAESLTRVSPDKVKKVNQALVGIWGEENYKTEHASLVKDVRDAVTKLFPSYNNVNNENASFHKESMINYLVHDIQTRVAANPDVDKDQAIKDVLKGVTSKVTDVSSTSYFSGGKVRGVFKKGSVEEVDTDALDNSLSDAIAHGKVVIDTAKLPESMLQFLKKAGMEKASDAVKSQEVLKRFKTAYVSKSLTGSSSDAEVNLTDGNYSTPLYIKKKDGKGHWNTSEVHTITGFSK